MNYKHEVSKLRREIEQLEEHNKVHYPDGTVKTEAEFKLQTQSAEKFVFGPWERLGVVLEDMMFRAIKGLASKEGKYPRDPQFEMTIDEALLTAKELCAGFFDKWEKDLDVLQFEHFTKIKEDLIKERDSKKSNTAMEEPFSDYMPVGKEKGA